MKSKFFIAARNTCPASVEQNPVSVPLRLHLPRAVLPLQRAHIILLLLSALVLLIFNRLVARVRSSPGEWFLVGARRQRPQVHGVAESSVESRLLPLAVLRRLATCLFVLLLFVCLSIIGVYINF